MLMLEMQSPELVSLSTVYLQLPMHETRQVIMFSWH